MKTSLFALPLLLSCFTTAHAIEIDSLDWTLKQEKDGIQVLSAKVPESTFSAYLAITTVKAPTEDLVPIFF